MDIEDDVEAVDEIDEERRRIGTASPEAYSAPTDSKEADRKQHMRAERAVWCFFEQRAQEKSPSFST